jgi:hypothetical protein
LNLVQSCSIMLLQWSAISAVAIRVERKEIVGTKLA